MNQICNKCNIIKSLDNFLLRNDTKKYRPTCKPCVSIAKKEKRSKIDNEIIKKDKKCKKCNLIKPYTEFHKTKIKSDGLTAHCKDCRQIKSKNDYEKRKEHIKKKTIEYYYKNKEKIIKKQNQRNIEKCKIDVLFKLKRRLRNRLYYALSFKKWKKNTKFHEYIGCSLKELKQHLEQQFQLGMTWENYGKWHIDHIVPLNSTQTEEELYKLCHYTNLQPLWAIDNIKKSNKIIKN